MASLPRACSLVLAALVHGLRNALLFLLLRLRPAVRGLAAVLLVIGPLFWLLYFELPQFRQQLCGSAIGELAAAGCLTVAGALLLGYYDRLLRALSRDPLWLPV